MKRTSNNFKLYQTLGLTRTDASPEEIKKAYKKMSMRYHPDRNRDNLELATAKMQEVNHANSILSDPKKKGIYDAYGEKGLQIYDSYMNVSDQEGGEMPLPPMVMMCCACVTIAVLLMAVCGFCIVLVLRMDDKLDWNWFVVFTPIWLIDILVLCSNAIISRGVQGGFAQKAAFAVIYMFHTALFTASQIMLCMRLNDPTSITFVQVFTPLLIVESLNLAGSIRSCVPSAYQAQLTAGHTMDSYPVYVFRKLSWAAFRILSLVFLVAKLEGALAWSWWQVFGPLWIWVVLEVLMICYTCSNPSAANEEAKAFNQQLQIGRFIWAIVFGGLLLLVTLRLEGVFTSTVYVFLPLFIISGLFFCCCCCLLCWGGGAAGFTPGPTEGQEVPQGDGSSDGASTAKTEEEAPLMGGGKTDYGSSAA